MKRSFFTGLALLLPFVITVFVVVFVFDFLTDPFVKYIKSAMQNYVDDPVLKVEHAKLLLFLGRLITLILLFFATVILGWAARRFFFRWAVKSFQKVMHNIPIIKKIYTLAEQVIESFIPAENAKVFQESVLIKFPHSESDVVGLLSGDAPLVAQKSIGGEEMKTVFVATAPHPVSGFLLMTAAKNLKPIDMSTEEVFKFLISCGISHPGEKGDE